MNGTYTTVIGNVVSDLKRRQVGENGLVVNFRVASNARRFDRATEQWTDGAQLFVGVTCWRRLGEGALLSLGKGDPVIVHGRLRSRSFEVEGQQRSVVELEAVAIGPDLSRSVAVVRRTRRPEQDTGRTDADGAPGAGEAGESDELSADAAHLGETGEVPEAGGEQAATSADVPEAADRELAGVAG
jgi:single-strand DNA-binding protein